MRQTGVFGFRCLSYSVLIIFLLSCACVQTALAQENPMDLFVDGVEAFEVSEYESALTSFNKAIALDPENGEFRYYKALTLAKSGDTDSALSILNTLVDQDPVNFRKALFDIGAIYLAQSQHEKALAPLEKAIHMDPQDARAYMEAAVAQKALGRDSQAISNLEMAASLDARQAPNAKLVTAAIYLDQEEFDKAEALYREVAETQAGTAVAEAATMSLHAVDQTRKYRKDWYVCGQFLWGYDDNVTFEPLETVKARSTKDQEDQYQNVYVEAGYRFINRQDFRLGASFMVNHQGYQDLAENNILSYNPTVFVEYLKKNKYYLRFSYDYAYYYTGGQDRDIQDLGWYLSFDSTYSKLQTHRLMPILTVYEPYGLSSVLTFAWMQKDYQDSTPDAHAYQAGLTQNWNVYKTPAVVRAGYQLYWEDAEISTFSYYSHTGLIGASCPLPWEMVGDIQYTYVRTHHDKSPVVTSGGVTSRYWVGNRKDSLHGFSANLVKPINDTWRLVATYYHGDNDSNVNRTYQGLTWDPYEFRKNIFSLSVACNF